MKGEKIREEKEMGNSERGNKKRRKDTKKLNGTEIKKVKREEEREDVK